MVARLLASTIMAAALMQGAAFAQGSSAKSNSANSNPSADANTNQSAQSLPQELAQKLKGQGFTNVQVVPGSFLVSAKDKDGDPVSMVIGPHSMTMFTAVSVDNRSTTGSGSSDSTKNGK